MKLSQVLLAGAVALVASNAMAYDIAHPFWGPAQGQFASETDYRYNRTDYNQGMDRYYQHIAEKISYGITDNWTVALTGAKGWAKYGKEGRVGQDNGKADFWYLSTTYNVINDGKNFAQVGLSYGQERWEGFDIVMDGEDKMYKEYELDFKGGFNLGTMTPYAEAYIGDTLNRGKNNDAYYGLRVALDTELAAKTSVDVGLSYDKQTAADHTYALDAALSYMFTKNVVGKVYGTFMLHDYEAGDYWRAQRSNTIGANVKVAF